MSKRQKGRRHRTVNRTPRPVGSRTSSHPVTRERESVAHTRESDTRVREVAAVATGTAAPPAPETSGPAAGTTDTATAADLGRHASRTWDALRATAGDGVSVQDLCATVGYQRPTILKHLKSMEGLGLAEQRGELWYPAAT